jgi:ATP/maltotriose-dependent transcriptional regulator MalT
MAQAVMANIMLASGQTEAASESAARSIEAAELSGDQLLIFAATIAINRVRGMSGNDVEGAVAALTRVADDARESGYTQAKLEAVLALAEILMASGEVEAANTHLDSVIEQAQELGLGQFLTRARAIR